MVERVEWVEGSPRWGSHWGGQFPRSGSLKDILWADRKLSESFKAPTYRKHRASKNYYPGLLRPDRTGTGGPGSWQPVTTCPFLQRRRNSKTGGNKIPVQRPQHCRSLSQHNFWSGSGTLLLTSHQPSGLRWFRQPVLPTTHLSFFPIGGSDALPVRRPPPRVQTPSRRRLWKRLFGNLVVCAVVAQG